ncbi:ceramidase [Nitzschia inconspicua]|uniref:Ceramidase n=1 Tax=Nitzschia inconspicua TaxID=303405 RepID=A0A9K3M6W3_9STRA|nr:ceramidase [Nitzschia inconspicua]
MPASLDENTRSVIVKVASISILVLSCAAWNAQKLVNQNTIPRRQTNPTLKLLWGCLATFILMVAASAIITTPILLHGQSLFHQTDKNTSIDVSSSINFCEMDFVDHPWVAEPANTASSLASYIPLALLGLYGPPSIEWRLPPNHNRRFRMSYMSLLAIGIGSTLLHALLTGLSQGGDELPMLWFMASLSFICLDLILCGLNKTRGTSMNSKKLQWLFSTSALGATLVYVLCRENFLPFYIMFIAYSWITLISLIMISFVLEWKDITFKTTVLLPLAICTSLHAIFGLTSWTSEMLFCNTIISQYQNQQESVHGTPNTLDGITHVLLPWFFNRGVHLCWHCSSALLAFLGIQTLLAAKGTQLGWGEAHIRWWGAPYVSFQKIKNQ